MSTRAVKLAGRPADKPFKVSAGTRGRRTEMTVFRWLELSRREISRARKKEGTGV